VVAQGWPVTLICNAADLCCRLLPSRSGIPGLGLSSHTELVPVEWRDFGRQIDGIAKDVRAPVRRRFAGRRHGSLRDCQRAGVLLA